MKSIIHTPTNKLENSLDFYSKLNYTVINAENPTLVTDGKAVIEINPDRFARAGLKLFKSTWSKEIAVLEKFTNIVKKEKEYIVSDPSGVWVYLVKGKSNITYELQEKSFGHTGNFQGLSLETTDMQRSLDFWKIFGFKENNGSVEQGWLSCTNADGFTISLMKALSCPHLFFNPSLTYFNGKDNIEIIKKIRKAKIAIAEEITHFNKEGIVDNVIIRDPGGYGFFIYSD